MCMAISYNRDICYQAACKLVAQTMSKKYGPSWNCVIGSSFASEMVFQKHTCLLLYYGGQFAIMLGKNP
jgi:dynein light chain 4